MLSTNQCDKASYRSIAIQDAIVQVFELKKLLTCDQHDRRLKNC